MNTRNAKTRQMENQLQLALQELKASKEQCELLLKERDDNEKEIVGIIAKNTQLKCDMVKLHTDYTSVIKERDQLQGTVNEFDQCSKEYEKALRFIAALKLQLNEANEQIAQFKTYIDNLKASQTQCLFSELVQCNTSKILQQSAAIDLTGDDSSTSGKTVRINCSKTKLKKYIKVNKYMKKIQKLIKNKINTKNYLNVCKEKQALLNELKLYSIEVDNIKKCYETDVECLKSEILLLSNSLQTLSNKYKSAQNEIKEHILAMDNLVKTCKYNEERFDSLVKHQCECQRSIPVSSESVCTDNIISPPKLYDSAIAEEIKIKNNSNIIKNNIIVYSDDMGKNLGIILNNTLRGKTLQIAACLEHLLVTS